MSNHYYTPTADGIESYFETDSRFEAFTRLLGNLNTELEPYELTVEKIIPAFFTVSLETVKREIANETTTFVDEVNLSQWKVVGASATTICPIPVSMGYADLESTNLTLFHLGTRQHINLFLEEETLLSVAEQSRACAKRLHLPISA